MPPGSLPPLLDKPPPLGLEGGFTIAILALALLLMAGDWVRPDINFLTTMAIYTAARFITVAQASAGFSNVGLLSVMSLFAVAAGVARTGGAAGLRHAWRRPCARMVVHGGGPRLLCIARSFCDVRYTEAMYGLTHTIRHHLLQLRLKRAENVPGIRKTSGKSNGGSGSGPVAQVGAQAELSGLAKRSAPRPLGGCQLEQPNAPRGGSFDTFDAHATTRKMEA
eukprot:366227-Chlamydomonas_euryale.AAC.20